MCGHSSSPSSNHRWGQARTNQFIRAFLFAYLMMNYCLFPPCFTCWKMTSFLSPKLVIQQKTLFLKVFEWQDCGCLDHLGATQSQTSSIRSSSIDRKNLLGFWSNGQLTGAGKLGGRCSEAFLCFSLLAPPPDCTIHHHLHLAWNVSLCSIWVMADLTWYGILTFPSLRGSPSRYGIFQKN